MALKQNIALPSLSRRRRAGILVDAAAEHAAIADEVRQFGVVTSSIDVPMRTLSGGNQQKALLARWHLANAEIFVLIEPTHGVDIAARADIYRRLQGLAAQGKVIVVVSSEIPEILALSDRILVFRDGPHRRRNDTVGERRRTPQSSHPGCAMSAPAEGDPLFAATRRGTARRPFADRVAR